MTVSPNTASLVFVHLSDLHFRVPGSPLADREATLRDRLLDDIPKAVALTSAGSVAAVLITGDIARSGQIDEYKVARAWLDELCRRVGVDSTRTLTCPGNHDVDRSRLTNERRKSNADLRVCELHQVNAQVDGMLADATSVLAPLEAYQEFAAGSACDIEKFLAWDLPPIPFGGGYSLAIRGANSVINSDEGDGAGTMAVQINQLRVSRDPGVVRLLLIHHSPYFWRREKPVPAKCGHNVVLYGHTHEPDHQVIDGTCLEITAGAVHPEESQVFAIPSYNVIEIAIEESVGDAYARVSVFHRAFSEIDDDFIGSGPGPAFEEPIRILRAGSSGTQEATATVDDSAADGEADEFEQGGPVNGEAEAQPPLETETGQPDPSRLVLVRFQRLGAGDRLLLLDRIGIPRSAIIDLPPHRQIREVARRVVAAGLVGEFLAAASQIDGGS